MSKTLMTLQKLHLGILGALKKADKSYTSLEEQTHEDPYKPILAGVLSEMEEINKGDASQVIPRLKGLEAKLSHLGLAMKAVESSFESTSPGSAMAMPEVKDPMQMTPDQREESIVRIERPSSIAVPGTENPRYGINAFSGSTSGSTVPSSSGGISFANRDKGQTMPQVSVAEALASNDITVLARSRKAAPGMDTRLAPAKFTLDADIPADRGRMQTAAFIEQERQASIAATQHSENTEARIGTTHIF